MGHRVHDPDTCRRSNTVDARSLGLAATSSATFVEGCGALIAGYDRWAWLDPETLTLSDPMATPGGYPVFASFTPTRDCAIAVILNPHAILAGRRGALGSSEQLVARETDPMTAFAERRPG